MQRNNGMISGRDDEIGNSTLSSVGANPRQLLARYVEAGQPSQSPQWKVSTMYKHKSAYGC